MTNEKLDQVLNARDAEMRKHIEREIVAVLAVMKDSCYRRFDRHHERLDDLEQKSHPSRPIPAEVDVRRWVSAYLKDRDAERRNRFYRQVGALTIKLVLPLAAIGGFWIAVVRYFS